MKLRLNGSATAICSPNAPQPRQPRRRARGGGGRESGLQQIAAGRRLPVDHLAGNEDARALPQHEVLVDLIPRDAAGGRDRPGDRSGSDETKWAGLDMFRERLAFGKRSRLAQDVDRGRRKAGAFAQERGHGLAGLALQPRRKIGLAEVGLEVDIYRRRSIDCDRIPKRGGERVDRAAFEAGARDHRLAANAHPGVRKRYIFEWRAGEGFPYLRRPVDEEAAIGGLQRRNRDSLGAKSRDPTAVRPEARPRGSAERENDRRRLHARLARRRHETKRPVLLKAEKAGARDKVDAELAEAPQPAAKKRRRLEALRKPAPARADKRLFAELRRPAAKPVRREGFNRRKKPVGGWPVTLKKSLQRLRMGEIEAAASCKQEFARRTRTRIMDHDASPGGRHRLRRHQPRRPCANDDRTRLRLHPRAFRKPTRGHSMAFAREAGAPTANAADFRASRSRSRAPANIRISTAAPSRRASPLRRSRPTSLAPTSDSRRTNRR